MADRKRKSKGFYKKMAKMSKHEHVQLGGGLRGFLVTCNFNEYHCLKDTYSVLDEVADKLYGPNTGQNNDAAETKDPDDEENIESSIEAELSALKSTKERRFHQVKTKCPNVIFVKTNDAKVKPNEVVEQLFKDIETTLVVNSRHILRIVPVNITFKAHKSVFFEHFTTFFDEMATKEPQKFSVFTKVRFNNDHPSESSLKEACIQIIKEKRPNWTVRHNNPEILIAINICLNAACLSLLQNYESYSKYNPGEFLKKINKPAAPIEKTEKEEPVVCQTTEETTPTNKDDIELATPTLTTTE